MKLAEWRGSGLSSKACWKTRRNPYVDPMSLLQVDLLARWRKSERKDPALFRALVATVYGIARGLNNTG